MLDDIGSHSEGVGERLKLLPLLIMDPNISGSSCTFGVFSKANYPGMESIVGSHSMLVDVLDFGRLP